MNSLQTQGLRMRRTDGTLTTVDTVWVFMWRNDDAPSADAGVDPAKVAQAHTATAVIRSSPAEPAPSSARPAP